MSPQQLASGAASYLMMDLGLALIALGVWWLGVALLQRSWGRWPLPGLGPFWAQLAWGGGLAAGGLALALLPAFIGGGYDPLQPGFSVFHYPCALPPPGFSLRLWGYFVVQAMYEELLFRGLGLLLLGLFCYWLARLVLQPFALRRAPLAPASRAWSRWAWYYAGALTSLVIAVAFAWAHRHNPNLSQLGLANIALAGWALGLICWWQGHPLGAWALHWIWNAGIASLGLPVSGILVSPPLIDGLGSVGVRPGWLTGGAFGPEGSLPAVLALLAVCLVLLWRMRCTVLAPLPPEPPAPPGPLAALPPVGGEPPAPPA